LFVGIVVVSPETEHHMARDEGSSPEIFYLSRLPPWGAISTDIAEFN
jgi:hypothetical protein